MPPRTSTSAKTAKSPKNKSLEFWIRDAACSTPGAKDSPRGERGGANQNLFSNANAPGIVSFPHAARPKARQGKAFLVNASQISEKGNPENSIQAHLIPAEVTPQQAAVTYASEADLLNAIAIRQMQTRTARTAKQLEGGGQ